MIVQLKDIASFSKGKQINGDDLVDGGQYVFLNGGINPSGKWNEYNVEGNSIAISEGGNSCGYVNYMSEPFWCGAHCYFLYDLRYDAKYTYYALKSQQDRIMRLRSGACMPNIKKNSLGEFSFSIEEDTAKQTLVVASLDKISELISLRKEQLAKLDELVKARFVELFGDPAGNPKKWNTLSFREASDRLSDGPFGSNLKSEHYTTAGVRVMRLGNIGVGQFIDNDKSYISEEHYEKLKKYTCKAGEIVIGTLGEPNLRACLVPQNIEYAVNKADCVHYIPKAEILNTKFVCQYINCPETLLLASGMVHGQTRSRISSGQLAEMPIFVPPIELQDQFAAFVEQTDKSKLAIQQSLDKLETLKKSLMQKYFG